MIEFDIEKILIAATREALGTGAACEFPNSVLDNKPDLWSAMHNIPGLTNPVSLGLYGDDNHNGILQIDFNVPVNTGTGEIKAEASRVCRLFPAGRKLGTGTNHVIVGTSSVSPGRIVGGFYRVSVNVTYYSRIPRR